jgi:hypothetical protein
MAAISTVDRALTIANGEAGASEDKSLPKLGSW